MHNIRPPQYTSQLRCTFDKWRNRSELGAKRSRIERTMIHDAANQMASSVPEELYNLTQLADVTLAAGKLSTTNIHTIKEYIKSEDPTPQTHTSNANETIQMAELIVMKRSQLLSGDASDSSSEMNSPQKLFSDAGYISDVEYLEKKHFLYALHSAHSQSMDTDSSITTDTCSSNTTPSIKSFTDHRQSSFSSSEDDSTYNYSHKIFDKRKSRKIYNHLQTTAAEQQLQQQQQSSKSVNAFNAHNLMAIETEDSMLSISEVESNDGDGRGKINKIDSNADIVSKGKSIGELITSETESMNGISGIDDVHTCPECGKKYSTSSNLARHRQTHRSLLDKKAKSCPHCSKVYVSIPAYSMHLKVHNQGCECPHCGKRFSRPWLLQGHIRTHTGEKPFQCSICTKSFADKSNLRAHIQTHSNTKPHTCSRCGKAFALKSYLYKHEESSCMRNHSKADKEKSKQAIRTKTLKKASTCGTNHSVVLKKIKEMANGNDTTMKFSEARTTAVAAATTATAVASKSAVVAVTTMAATASTQECIFLDAGSKKSYIDLTESKANMEPYPRISVIRTIGVQSPGSTAKSDQFELYQEKPVDFSPKNKYKSEYTSNGNKTMSHSTQYTAMVV